MKSNKRGALAIAVTVMLAAALAACAVGLGSESGADPPSSESRSDAPGSGSRSDAPGSESGADPPSSESRSDAPDSESGADPPSVQATISFEGKSAVIELGNSDKIPFAELGSTISLDFKDARPGNVSVIEALANADGSRKYDERADRTLDVELSGGNLATFAVTENWAAALSSNSGDYEPGNSFRWYRIICGEGEAATEYGLWVRTDPAILLNAQPDAEDAADIYRGITVGSTKADVIAAFPEIGPAEQRVKALWHDDYTAGVRVSFYLDDGETVIRAETEELPPEFENRSYERQLTDYLAALFDEAYSPYYDGLRYEMSNYAETFDDGGYAATFFWTMYHRDSGGDVSADSGRETYGNFSFRAAAKTAGGKIDFQTLSVLGDISMTGTRDYAAPIESYFPDEQSTLTLTGYIRAIDVQSLALDFDRVYWLSTPENDDYLKELGVDPNELSNGFYIYDPEEEVYRYGIGNDAVFEVLEIPEGEAWRLAETDMATLARQLNTRTNLYAVVVSNGAITRVSERYVP